MPFFDGAAGQVYYRNWMATTPVANLVFLHGFGEHTGLYHRLAASLGEHNINLWALDEIGHGLSDGARGHIDSLDQLVENGQKLTDLAETTEFPVILAGHSMGGITAALTAIRFEDRYQGLVLSGTPLQSPQWMTDLLSEPTASNNGFSLDIDDLSSDAFYLDALENDPLAFTEADVVETMARTFPPAWEEIAEKLPTVTVPVLAVHGANDPIAPVADAEESMARVPDGRISVFPECRHDVLNDRLHVEVANLIAAFVVTTTNSVRTRSV